MYKVYVCMCINKHFSFFNLYFLLSHVRFLTNTYSVVAVAAAAVAHQQ